MAKPIARFTKNACGAGLAWKWGKPLKSKADGKLGFRSQNLCSERQWAGFEYWRPG
ncbi:hypothetical protein TRIATDRAFT_255009 [Trichoderma atroviride IMI 206040]|uniref:Uncharacterized protein n=1 Tax=Hypocrea atroviridis (strain ATCC 20476 / IMI 206040) TaxID=452589 RepID=G9NJ47_HYPAI|nr:uncharacterized protein TRIATDRAFT_255009 [Trichoderma atroviride IMI 206040]EHK48923.1 hypothetical protein TRIATDRAFT_255009 [Trichoderma atroviride IMI 206040]